MKISWNEFCDMLEALKSGAEAQRLAEKEKWINEMMSKAREVKADLAQVKADLKTLEAGRSELKSRQEKLEEDRKQCDAQKARLGAAELAHETRVKTFRSEMARAEQDLQKRQDAVANLEARAGEGFRKADEALEHLRAAGVSV